MKKVHTGTIHLAGAFMDESSYMVKIDIFNVMECRVQEQVFLHFKIKQFKTSHALV